MWSHFRSWIQIKDYMKTVTSCVLLSLQVTGPRPWGGWKRLLRPGLQTVLRWARYPVQNRTFTRCQRGSVHCMFSSLLTVWSFGNILAVISKTGTLFSNRDIGPCKLSPFPNKNSFLRWLRDLSATIREYLNNLLCLSYILLRNTRLATSERFRLILEDTFFSLMWTFFLSYYFTRLNYNL